MNKILILVFFTRCFFSCSPKLTTKVFNSQPALVEEDIVVLKQENVFKNPGIEVGSLSSGDNGFSINCSYDEVLKILKEQARKNGANILKITEHKLPNGRKSTCDRIQTISANAYPARVSKKLIIIGIRLSTIKNLSCVSFTILRWVLSHLLLSACKRKKQLVYAVKEQNVLKGVTIGKMLLIYLPQVVCRTDGFDEQAGRKQASSSSPLILFRT